MGSGMVEERVQEVYLVRCIHCETEYDACRSPWCECITASPSLVCPECLACFCDADAAARRRFWWDAPRELWRRRLDRGYRELLPEAPSEEAAGPGRPLALIADDDPASRCIAGRALAALGFSVLLAEDGERACQLALQHQPDLVLTDCLMPRLDGKALCRRLRGDRRTSGARLVMMSALHRGASVDRNLLEETGADEFLPKPIPWETLAQAVRRWAATAAR